ncbi:MAG: hypothetical protein HRT86_14565 [Ilumatobacteraceae bacterium]|nr:hypothetical protein [Ilumatobacteraceae bacterium]
MAATTPRNIEWVERRERSAVVPLQSGTAGSEPTVDMRYLERTMLVFLDMRLAVESTESAREAAEESRATRSPFRWREAVGAVGTD